MKNIVRKSKIAMVNKGDSHKIVEISGSSDSTALRHYCNNETVLIISEGNIGLQVGSSAHLLKQTDFILIPARQRYVVVGLSAFKALLIMPFNSRLISINKNPDQDSNKRKNNR